MISHVLLFPLLAQSPHRSAAVRREFQRSHPCPSTGLTHGACPGYIRDHIVALDCGGSDSSKNLQWQTVADAKKKDRTKLVKLAKAQE
jgi:hypothetical protein